MPRDYSEAVRWYRKAAERGCGLAQKGLSLCYIRGHGVDRNPSEAYAWLRLAAMDRRNRGPNGWWIEESIVPISEGEQSAQRDWLPSLTSQMSPDELVAGERLYNQYLAFKGNR